MQIGSFGVVTSLIGLAAGLAIGFGPVRTAAMNDPTRYTSGWVLPGDRQHILTGQPWTSVCKQKAARCERTSIPLSPMPLVYRTAGEGLGAGMLYGLLISWAGRIRRRTGPLRAPGNCASDN